MASERGHDSALKGIARIQAILRNDPAQEVLSKPKAKKPKPNQPCSCGLRQRQKVQEVLWRSMMARLLRNSSVLRVPRARYYKLHTPRALDLHVSYSI